MLSCIATVPCITSTLQDVWLYRSMLLMIRKVITYSKHLQLYQDLDLILVQYISYYFQKPHNYKIWQLQQLCRYVYLCIVHNHYQRHSPDRETPCPWQFVDWGDLCRIKSDGQSWLPSACPLQAGASVYQQHNFSVMDHTDLLLTAGQTLYVMSNIHKISNINPAVRNIVLHYNTKSTNFLPQMSWISNLDPCVTTLQ